MDKFSLKQKLIALAIVVGSALILVFTQGLYPKSDEPRIEEPATVSTNNVQIVSTNPAPLDNTTILPTQSIEITFDTPLQNEPETKILFNPSIEHKIELSTDRKTVKIIPNDVWELGVGYSMSIKSDTKFDQDKKLDQDKEFHFATINYRGV